jgi:hypothetical protein
MANKPPLVAARYKGDYPVVLSRQHGPIRDDQGQRIDGMVIGKGDVVMLPAAEVLGQTYWHDPHHQAPSLYIGVGAVVRPEHAGLSRAELQAIGYDFHEGRSDFEAVVSAPAAPQAAPQTTRAPAQPLAEPVVANEDTILVEDDPEPADAPADEPASDAAATSAEGV